VFLNPKKVQELISHLVLILLFLILVRASMVLSANTIKEYFNILWKTKKACLASIIVVALKTLFLKLGDLPLYWKVNKIEFV
jgi:hypothetical protein